MSLVRIFVKPANKCQSYREGNSLGRNHGPRSGWVPVGDGVGRKEIFGEDIGPRPGRVPGLFRQKGGLVSFIYLTVLFLSCRVPF